MAISFTKTNWADTDASGTALTAAQLNRLENACSSLVSAVNAMSKITKIYSDENWMIYTISNIVFIYAQRNKTDTGNWTYSYCKHTLNAKYRPSKDIVVPAISENGGSWTGVVCVKSDGTMYVGNFGNDGTDCERYGFIVYPIGM